MLRMTSAPPAVRPPRGRGGSRHDGRDPARLCSPSRLASITISVKVRADGNPGDDGGSSGPARHRPAPDPVAAQAVRDVLLTLSRAVQQATIYPPGHPNVAIAAQPVTEALGRVLVRGAHLTLAFSSDGVFAGTTPQQLHPYDAPWLAHRLVDRGVASLEFGGQLAPADAAALIAWLAQGDALRPGAALPAFGACALGALDYSKARFREARARERAAVPVSIAWRSIASSLAGDWSGTNRTVPSSPSELAHHIVDVLDAQEGAGYGELSDRLGQVNALFVGLSDDVKATVKGRLVEFIDALTPELRTRVLAASPGDHAGKLDLLGALVDRLPRAHLVDLIAQLRFERGDSTHQFLVLMLKLTNLAASDVALGSNLTGHCRRAGMPLPAQELGDAPALRALEDMLSARVADAIDANPDDYQASLEALGGQDVRPGPLRFGAAHLGDPRDADALSAHVAGIAAQLLRGDGNTESDVATCVSRVQRELPRLRDARQFEALADAASALARPASRRGRAPGGRAPHDLEFFASAPMIQDVVALAELVGDGPARQAATLAHAGGAAAATALMTRLGQRPGRDIARRLAAIVASFEPHAIGPAASEVLQRTPGIAHDLAVALLDVDSGPGSREIGRVLFDHPDATVRIDACRLTFASGAAGLDAAIGRALRDNDPRVIDVALSAADEHPALLDTTAVRDFLAAGSTAPLVALQSRAVALMTKRPTPVTRSLLAEALSQRRARLDGASRRVSRTICGALTGIGSADALAAVSAWRRSPAGLLSRLLRDPEASQS